MHAFLIIGNNYDPEPLAKRLGAKVFYFPLKKIEDTRNLNNLIRLSITEPTLIVSENIHEATTEALNAFLKNLEEPQKDLYFVLTSPSIRKVMPTIVSRCQVIKVQSTEYKALRTGIEEFLKMSIGQRLAFFGKIKDRNEAIGLVEDIIYYLHEKGNLTNMEVLLKTLSGLKANGNVNLQLSNLAINFD